jgi:methyltransferase (TIGR00027 family)
MQDRASRTAAHVALFRALESARRTDRLFVDPYAVRFLPWRYRAVARAARIQPVGRWLERYIDSRWAGGPRGSAVVRTRLIDDWITASFEAGADQLLLLGAGFDSRAHRLPSLTGIAAFEVDHPATQAVKRRALARAGQRDDVRLVPVDLIGDDLDSALNAAGFDHTVRTAVVWEGVTNYLTGEAVDATLRYLGQAIPAGSRIVFTYIDRAVLDGTGAFAEVGTWRDAVAAAGEPWTFGFDPADLGDYLAERGLRLVEDVSTRDAAERYHRIEPTAAFYRIVLAEVRS